jgi:hypothetical protein
MANSTFTGRIISAAIGSIFGAIIGFILAWLLGVYSQTLGSGEVHTNLAKWVGIGAVFFGALGFIVDEHIGTIIGHVLNALFQFEDQRNYEFGGWFIWTLVIVLLVGGWLWFKHQ